MDSLDSKAIDIFRGKIVRKDLTALMKVGANVPTFVLEYLLGMYCSTDNENAIKIGIEKIRKILSENYVRPDESERIKMKIRENGEYTVIDKIEVFLDEKEDKYIAQFTNLKINKFEIASDFVVNNEKLLTGGVWCILRIAYIPAIEEEILDEDDEDDDIFVKKSKKKTKYESPFVIRTMNPIQMPNLNINEIIDARKEFTKDEWIAFLLRSMGYEPDQLNEKQRFHLLLRLVPLIQKNYNLVELGPRGTGKSHVFQELSPYSILMSGGKTTVSNLFYNMASRKVGLVGMWDCIAFDEVAGIRFPDMDGIQILKNYMANGTFARGKNSINADVSICFVGNTNDSVENMIKITHLFNPFPSEFNNDSAFFDRIHYYLPGWETPKLRNDLLTEHYGLISDCLSEFCRAMRKYDYSNMIDNYFEFNNDFNKRDDIAVRKTVSGLAKLIYPNKNASKEEIRELLEYAIEGRRRVKEQLKKMAGVEFIDTNLGYKDNENNEMFVIQLPEQISHALVPETTLPAGHIFAIGKSMNNNEVCIYRLENKTIAGSGKLETQGIPSYAKRIKECVNAAFVYFCENAKSIINARTLTDHDYLLYYADTQEKGVSDEISLAEFIGLCSALSEKPVIESVVVVGEIKLSGTMMPLTSIEDIVRISINAGAKRILLPMDSMKDYSKMSEALTTKISPIFYVNPIDAAKKALNVF